MAPARKQRPVQATPAAAALVQYPANCPEVSAALSPTELARRLKVLHATLQHAEPDETPAARWAPLARHLAQQAFVDHTANEVKILVACCLADLFRLFVPDSPYEDESQLKAVLVFLIQQLRGVDTPNDHLFPNYFYLLENLAAIRPLNLACGLQDSQEVLCQLVRHAFAIMTRHKRHMGPEAGVDARVPSLLVDIVHNYVATVDHVGYGALDAMFAPLVEPNRSAAAYDAAAELIRRVEAKIDGAVQSFFTVALSGGGAGRLAESTLVASGRTYVVIGELYAVAPDLVAAVLPQLEQRLHTEDDRDRLKVVKMLGRMFQTAGDALAADYLNLWHEFAGRSKDKKAEIRAAFVQHAAHILIKHPACREKLWHCLRQRLLDVDESIRIETIKAITTAALKDVRAVDDHLLVGLRERARDKKFAARKEALIALGKLYRRASAANMSEGDRRRLRWIPDVLLHSFYQITPDDRMLAERLLHMCIAPYDVPAEGRMRSLLAAFASCDAHAARALEEILRHQSKVREHVRAALRDARNDAEWADGGDAALAAATAQPSASTASGGGGAQSTPENSQRTVEARQRAVDAALKQLAERFPSFPTAAECVRQLHAALCDDRPAQRALKAAVSIGDTTDQVHASVRDFLGRFARPPRQNLIAFVKSLVERAAPLLLDTAAADVLMRQIAGVLGGEITFAGVDQDLAAERALKLLETLLLNFAACFRTPAMMQAWLGLLEMDNHVAVATALRCFAALGEQDVRSACGDEQLFKRIIDRTEAIAGTTSDRPCAKAAVACADALCADRKEVVFGRVLEARVRQVRPLEELFPSGCGEESAAAVAAQCAAALAALSALVIKHAVSYREQLGPFVADTLVKGVVLGRARCTAAVASADGAAESGGAALPEPCPEVLVKLSAYQFVSRYALGLMETAAAHHALDLFATVVSDGGEIDATGGDSLLDQSDRDGASVNGDERAATPPPPPPPLSAIDKAHLRLGAAKAFLKLMCNRLGSSQLNMAHFRAVAYLTADPLAPVRCAFAGRLHKRLYRLELPMEWMAAYALVPVLGVPKSGGGEAAEALRRYKKKCQDCVMENVKIRRAFLKKRPANEQLQRSLTPEYGMQYVVHVLAHHRRFADADNVPDAEIYDEIKACLWFYMQPFVQSHGTAASEAVQHANLMHKVLTEVKLSTDLSEKDNDGHNMRLWSVADMALLLLAYRVPHFVIHNIGGPVRLSGRWYCRSKRFAAGDAVNTSVYLPKEQLDIEREAHVRKRAPPLPDLAERRGRRHRLLSSASVSIEADGDEGPRENGHDAPPSAKRPRRVAGTPHKSPVAVSQTPSRSQTQHASPLALRRSARRTATAANATAAAASPPLPLASPSPSKRAAAPSTPKSPASSITAATPVSSGSPVKSRARRRTVTPAASSPNTSGELAPVAAPAAVHRTRRRVVDDSADSSPKRGASASAKRQANNAPVGDASPPPTQPAKGTPGGGGKAAANKKKPKPETAASAAKKKPVRVTRRNAAAAATPAGRLRRKT